MTDSKNPDDFSNTEIPLETSYAGGSAASDGYTPDKVLAGRYELKEKLDSGGMGSVWGAHDRTTDIEVVIKIMRPRQDAPLNAAAARLQAL